jgi:hypothetical protein
VSSRASIKLASELLSASEWVLPLREMFIEVRNLIKAHFTLAGRLTQ